MAKTSDVLYIGIGGHVVAIDRATGQERWRCKLRSATFVTISVQPDAIYAGASGELFCVDPATGTVRWKNRLKGLGMSVIAFDANTTATVLAAAAAAQAAMMASGGGS